MLNLELNLYQKIQLKLHSEAPRSKGRSFTACPGKYFLLQ